MGEADAEVRRYPDPPVMGGAWHHLDPQQGMEKDGGGGQEQVPSHNRGHGAGERGRGLGSKGRRRGEGWGDSWKDSDTVR